MILVTGGTGLVGSYLIMHLVKNDEKVRAIFRNKKSIQKTKKVFLAHQLSEAFEKIEWWEADLINYFELKDAFQGIDKVYHAAAKVSFAAKDAAEMMKVNIEGTENIVNLSLEFGINKLCYFSSVAALGSYRDDKCIDENALWQKTDNTTSYSISKYYAENEVWRAAEEGLSVVIVNPATILGFGDLTESSSTIIKKVIDGLSFYSPGSNGFVGVKDVVNVAIQLMNSKIEGERYLLAAENLHFKKLLRIIAENFNKTPPKHQAKRWMANIMCFLDQSHSKVLNKKPILSKESVTTAFKHRCYNSDKIKAELDFKFQPIEEVLKEAATFYQKEL